MQPVETPWSDARICTHATVTPLICGCLVLIFCTSQRLYIPPYIPIVLRQPPLELSLLLPIVSSIFLSWFNPAGQLGPAYRKPACSLRVVRLPPVEQRHACWVNWRANGYLSVSGLGVVGVIAVKAPLHPWVGWDMIQKSKMYWFCLGCLSLIRNATLFPRESSYNSCRFYTHTHTHTFIN